MNEALPDPHSDQTAPAVAAARRLRAQLATGAISADPPYDPQETGAPDNDADTDGFYPSPAKANKWWNYMPNETQLMVFLAEWLKQRRNQTAVQLSFPLPGMGEAKIPVVTFSVSVTDTQLVLLVEPSLSGLQLPNGYEVKVITPERTFQRAVYLGSFQPLPSFPFAVVSFLLDENS